MRLNLKCIRAPVRHVLPTGSADVQGPGHSTSPSQPHLETATPLNQGLQPCTWTGTAASGERVESPHHRHVFRYYVTVLAYHLTVSERFNSFLSGKRDVPRASAGLTV